MEILKGGGGHLVCAALQWVKYSLVASLHATFTVSKAAYKMFMFSPNIFVTIPLFYG